MMGKQKKDQTELPLLEIEESDESDNVIELKIINVEKRASKLKIILYQYQL